MDPVANVIRQLVGREPGNLSVATASDVVEWVWGPASSNASKSTNHLRVNNGSSATLARCDTQPTPISTPLGAGVRDDEAFKLESPQGSQPTDEQSTPPFGPPTNYADVTCRRSPNSPLQDAPNPAAPSPPAHARMAAGRRVSIALPEQLGGSTAESTPTNTHRSSVQDDRPQEFVRSRRHSHASTGTAAPHMADSLSQPDDDEEHQVDNESIGRHRLPPTLRAYSDAPSGPSTTEPSPHQGSSEAVPGMISRSHVVAFVSLLLEQREAYLKESAAARARIAELEAHVNTLNRRVEYLQSFGGDASRDTENTDPFGGRPPVSPTRRASASMISAPTADMLSNSYRRASASIARKLSIVQPDTLARSTVTSFRRASIAAAQIQARRRSSVASASSSTPATAASPQSMSPTQTNSMAVRFTTVVDVGDEDFDGSYNVNQYVVLDFLGHGKQGEVHLGFDTLNRECRAMKIMKRPPPDLGPSATALDCSPRAQGSAVHAARNRILRVQLDHEIGIMKRCLHPNIVRLYEVLDDATNEKLYLVMQYAEHGALRSIRRDGTIERSVSADLLVTYATQLTGALQYLHRLGIVHNDVKPDNIMLCPDDRVLLADFGMAEIVTKDISATPRFVVAGDLMTGAHKQAKGTVAFMAPELLSSTAASPAAALAPGLLAVAAKVAAEARDVWSLGVTFYVLLYGRLPWRIGGLLADLIDDVCHVAIYWPGDASKTPLGPQLCSFVPIPDQDPLVPSLPEPVVEVGHASHGDDVAPSSFNDDYAALMASQSNKKDGKPPLPAPKVDTPLRRVGTLPSSHTEASQDFIVPEPLEIGSSCCDEPSPAGLESIVNHAPATTRSSSSCSISKHDSWEALPLDAQWIHLLKGMLHRDPSQRLKLRQVASRLNAMAQVQH